MEENSLKVINYLAENEYQKAKEDGTINENELYMTLNDSENKNIADYVVETGTSGIWTYQKWASGKAECWGRNTMTAISQEWKEPIYYLNSPFPILNYPFEFKEPPQEFTMIADCVNACWVYKEQGEGNRTTTTKTAQYRAIKVNAFVDGNVSATISYYVIGKWK